MIDLRKKGLPNVVYFDGKPFSIYTDFREWIKYSEIIKSPDATLGDIAFLFKNEIPVGDFSPALFEFYANPNITPTGEGSSEVLFDYIQDGEYIFSSFLQVYGIDLTEVDMHWHKFKALFISLPAECKMGQIMGDRGYKEDKRKYEEIAKERKRDWSLPQKEIDTSKVMDEINADFYACV